jgi:hypothetical protein
VIVSATTRWLTPPQIAVQLGVDVAKVHGWIHRGELVASDLSERRGGQRPRWRIDPAELSAFLRRRQAQPPAPRKQGRKQQRKEVPQYV